MFNVNSNTPPVPERLIGGDIANFIESYLESRSVYMENSESRLMTQIIRHLGKSDPKINAILERATKTHEETSKQFIRERSSPRLPRMLRRKDIPCLEANEDNEIEALLPRLASLRVHINPRELATRNIKDIWNACTVPCPRLNGWPNWGNEEFSNDEKSYWFSWTNKPTAVSCVAGVAGSGRTQDEWVSNTARWYWLFSPQVSESLDVWVSNRLSGPCAWRRNGGDVSVWIMTEVKVEKYIPGNIGWQLVKSIPRTIRLLYSTNSGLDMNGSPPQGYFGGSSRSSYVEFSPTDEGFAIDVEEGFFHLIGVDVTMVLTANEHARVGVGMMAGNYFDPCKLKAYCTLCRCT